MPQMGRMGPSYSCAQAQRGEHCHTKEPPGQRRQRVRRVDFQREAWGGGLCCWGQRKCARRGWEGRCCRKERWQRNKEGKGGGGFLTFELYPSFLSLYFCLEARQAQRTTLEITSFLCDWLFASFMQAPNVIISVTLND